MSFALHTAAREGDLAALKALVAQGSSISVRDKHSRTPLHLSAWAGHLECCKLLIEHGADKSSAAMDDTTALHFAAQKGHPEVVRFLLNEGNLELVRLLVKRKADVTTKNKSGKTAADFARDPAVKEVLNQAALTASISPEVPGQSDTKSPEPSGHHDAADVPKPNNADAPANVEIGPQERPNAGVLADSASGVAPDLSEHPTVELHNKRTKPEHEPHSLTNDPEACRPSKLHKVALSFAEDDDADEV